MAALRIERATVDNGRQPITVSRMATATHRCDRYGRPLFIVTRLFTGGNLVGLTHTAETPVEFRVGQTGGGSGFGSPFRIVEVQPVLEQEVCQ